MKETNPQSEIKTQTLYYNDHGFYIMMMVESGLVLQIDFIDCQDAQASFPSSTHPFIKKLADYLSGKDKDQYLDLPYRFSPSSAFMKRVYQATQQIPRGQTSSYAQIAAQAGSPKAARAVGRAMATNPLPLIIPCHRVIGSSGKLTGFGGGLDLKTRLLELERN